MVDCFTVHPHQESVFKFYYIQDFEPEFYDAADPQYLEAARTYDFPLRQVGLGQSLQNTIAEYTGRKPGVMNFAIDDSILRVAQPPEERKGPPIVLFFARLGLKRRSFELGNDTLAKVKQQRPDVEILLCGSTDKELGPLPFKSNLGILNKACRGAQPSTHPVVLLT